MCYHAELGRSALKNVGINAREPQKLESAGTPPYWGGVWLTTNKQAPSPDVLPCEIWWFCVNGCVHI